uniref:AB hydrolase-1 domain-containing protein n=2 Tax=Strongyloides stercoralis TaxID=6248 RepID=A0A0K0DSA5_STRER
MHSNSKNIPPKLGRKRGNNKISIDKNVISKDTENNQYKIQKAPSKEVEKKISKVGRISSITTKVEQDNRKKFSSTKNSFSDPSLSNEGTKNTSKNSKRKLEGTKKSIKNIKDKSIRCVPVGNKNKLTNDIIEDELYVCFEDEEHEEGNSNRYEDCSSLSTEEKYDLYYNCLPIKPVKMYGKQVEFYKALQGLKNQKYSIDCTCNKIRNSIVTKIEKKSFGIYSNTKNLFKVFFKKSTGKNLVERCAFWPSKCEYFFYQINGMKGKSYQEQIDNHIIFIKGYGLNNDELKAKMNPKNIIMTKKVYIGTPECLNSGNFLFGFNHPCFFLTDPIEFFFLKTEMNDIIACAYTKLKRNSKYTFIYSHPNAMDLSDSICGFPNISDLARFLEVNFMTYDYSGYGISSGTPSEAALKSNLRTVINYLVEEKNVSVDKIVLFGYSIGASLSAIIAEEYPNLGGLILFGAPASLGTVLKYQLLKSNIKIDDEICDDVFNTVKAISNVNARTLIVQSKVDKMVPHSNGFAIFKNAKNPVPPYLLSDIKHNYMDSSSKALLKIKEFIQYTLKQDPLK